MSQVELFALLQRKNLIVTDTPFPDEVEFDEHGLRTLSALDSQVSIQGVLEFKQNILILSLNSSRFFRISQLSEVWPPPSDRHRVGQRYTRECTEGRW